jgi:hypothetical protein
MSNHNERHKLFSELISHRGRDFITLVTSTKQPEEHFAAQIAGDVIPIFYDLLKSNDGKKEVDIFLYSAGGMVDAPWPIINLIREYYENVSVIIPFKAHSAATLISLGADMINMGPMASLSPIDPQLYIRNPEGKANVSAGIEDIYGYYLLIEDTLKLDANGKTEALKILANRISPEILGQASRIRNEIRIIATNMLKLHIKDSSKIDSIVTSLVEKLHSHQYMINRKEAKQIGLPVSELDKTTENLAYSIIRSYIDECKMDEPGVKVDFGSGENTKSIEMNRAFIETVDRSYTFRTRYTFHKDGKLEKAINKWMEAKDE